MYTALIIISVCAMAVGVPCYAIAIKPGFSLKTLFLKILCSSLFLLIAVLSALKTGNTGMVFARSMIMGFACSWVGDVLLHLDPPITRIALGVAAFLTAHIFFIYAYVKTLGGAFITAKETAAICILWAIVIVLVIICKIKLNLYAIIAAIYGTVLMFMLVKAFELGLSNASENPWSLILLTGGALLFAVSDATLGAGFFGKPTYKSKVINVTTYFIGQTLLALSILTVTG